MQTLGNIVVSRDRKESEEAVRVFNASVAIGSTVRYYPSRSSKDSSVHETRSSAMVNTRGVPVIFITERTAAVALDSIEVVA